MQDHNFFLLKLAFLAFKKRQSAVILRDPLFKEDYAHCTVCNGTLKTWSDQQRYYIKFQREKHGYLIHSWSDKGWKDAVVN